MSAVWTTSLGANRSSRTLVSSSPCAGKPNWDPSIPGTTNSASTISATTASIPISHQVDR